MLTQLLNIVLQLKTGTIFSITSNWLKLNGINATPTDAKILGREFAKVFLKFSCKTHRKKTNNLRVYEKL